ncbi:hypothetical protein WJX75_003202 [Coccomyxa subellipsoidea]|uniref:Methyltransferase-like protein 17, mitochondrial n=1 Tax=Coccomyxa subellipsoidea TaxID=248742 RepID=A0ABR2YR62_9CHLO
MPSLLEIFLGTRKPLRYARSLAYVTLRSLTTTLATLVLPSLDSKIDEDDTPSPPAKVRRKGPDSWHQKVQSLLNTSGALNLDEAVQTAQPEDNDWISEKSKSAQQGKRGTQLQYNENQAIAYVASRMPGCYAAVYNIMHELSARLPHFRPQSMLDFGSGPGTAVWAAQEIWDGAVHDVLAVESSPAMAALGQRIQEARQSSAEEASQHSQQKVECRRPAI